MTVAKANTAATNALMRQYISKPLAGSQTISGTVKGTVRCSESGVNDNLDRVWMKLILVSNDGSTLRGAFLNLGGYGPQNEWDTTLEARRIADGDSITSQAVTDGDRIILEIGEYNTNAGSGVSGDMSFGDDSGTDLGDNETDQTAYNPFIEFSYTIAFQATTHSMSGSLSGGATTSGAMQNHKLLKGSLSGSGTTGGAMKRVVVLTGSLSGGGATSGAAVLAKKGSGSLSGGATTSGVMENHKTFAGSLSGGASTSGAFVLTAVVTGSLSGGAETSGADVLVMVVTGSLSGGASTSGAFVLTAVMTGSLSGSATTSGAMENHKTLTGSLSGSATTSGDMDVIPEATGWQGACSGGATTSGVMDVHLLLTGSLAGGAETLGAMSSVTLMTGALVGEVTTSGIMSVLTSPYISGALEVMVTTSGHFIVWNPEAYASYAGSVSFTGNKIAAVNFS